MAIQKNFVVKHGLEVRDQLIFANALNSRVGINTSIPKFTLDVNGGIGATSLFLSDGLSLSGVLTTKNLDLSGYISIGGTTGIEGQYLRSTGTGVEWATFPQTRTKATFSATPDQTIFSFQYDVGFIDVFVNGVKLKGDGVEIFDEFIANDGSIVQLLVPRIEGDIVEFIGYSPTSSINSTSIGGTFQFGESYWTETTVGIHTLSNVGVGTTNPTSKLTINGDVLVSGVVTAVSFIGDGSGLTNIVATGTGVDIRDDGSLVGTAATINFGNNLTVNFSGGVATIDATSGISDVIIPTSEDPPESPVDGNLWYDKSIGRGFIYYDDGDSSQWVDFSPALSGISTGGTEGGESYWTETTAGIHTLSNVGIGTTNPTSALTVKGNAEIIGKTSFKGPIYEVVSNNFSDTLSPSSGILTLSTSDSPILVGILDSTVTTWAFTGVNTSNGSSITLTTIIDSNSLYTYGDSCTVNGVQITGGIRWPGGIPPVATNNEDILSFTIITDNSSETRVYGSYQLNYS
jgi:hypothetical protein